MIPIVCTTNLDAYNSSFFPSLSVIPRVGEYVEVKEIYKRSLNDKHFPTRLEVVAVTYVESAVIVELWYNKTDFELYKQAGYKIL